MKKAKQIFFTLILIVSAFNFSKAQSISSVSDSSIFAPQMKAAKLMSRSDFRKIKREFRHGYKMQTSHKTAFQLFNNKTFAPKLSVDLLDGKGIHLFSISNIDHLPTINVGARIKASIIINL